MVSKDGRIKVQGVYRSCWRTDQCVPVDRPGKHRYLMPLDDAMRAQIAPLAKPYPKRAKDQDAEHPSALGGESPTRTLQINEVTQ